MLRHEAELQLQVLMLTGLNLEIEGFKKISNSEIEGLELQEIKDLIVFYNTEINLYYEDQLHGE